MGRLMVQIFEEAARPPWAGPFAVPSSVHLRDVPVVEHNGDFYQCDHFVTPEHRIGNIRETPLANCSRVRHKTPSPGQGGVYCRATARRGEVRGMCNGGCPKDRIHPGARRRAGPELPVRRIWRFFTHCRPYTERMAAHRWAGHDPESLMAELRAEETEARPKSRAQRSCPCGSGRKFKACCLRA